MTITASTIITFASLLSAIIAIFAIVFKVHKWYLKQEKQDADIQQLKAENELIYKGVHACLDGLVQLGCNHSVPKAKEELEEYINRMAHQ